MTDTVIRTPDVRTRDIPCVIDSDAHVLETERTWDYLDPKFSRYRPQLYSAPDDPSRQVWIVDGKLGGRRFKTLSEKELADMSRRTGRDVTATVEAKQLDDVSLRLKGMDQLGVDMAVLHNSFWLDPIDDRPEVEGALCQSWNRWMADIHAQGQGRLYWTCVVPAYDHEFAVEEMRFAKDHGAVSLAIRAFEGDLIVSDPYFYPLFDEAVKLDLSVAIHIASGNATLQRLLRTRYSPYSAWGSRVQAMCACMAIISSPVKTTFPTLRWGIIEAGASWVPWLNYEYQRRTGKASSAGSNPFHDFNIFVTSQVDEDIPYIVSQVGEGVLLIGTDFGHTDTSSEYDSLMTLHHSDSVSPSVRRAMLYDNPSKMFGLSSDALLPGSDS